MTLAAVGSYLSSKDLPTHSSFYHTHAHIGVFCTDDDCWQGKKVMKAVDIDCGGRYGMLLNWIVVSIAGNYVGIDFEQLVADSLIRLGVNLLQILWESGEHIKL